LGIRRTFMGKGFHGTAATSSPAPDQYARIASPLHTFLVLAAQMGLALRAMARLGHMGAAANMDRVQIYDRTSFPNGSCLL